MHNNFILTALIAHVIGDFYLQSKNMSEEKKKNIKIVFKHSLFYSIPFLILYIFTNRDYKFFIALLLMCISHCIIDLIKFFFCNKINKYAIRHWIIYVLDQLIHIVIIITILLCFNLKNIKVISVINDTLKLLSFNGLLVLRWTLLSLLLFKPVNVTFKILFKKYKPCDGDDNGCLNSGAVIGFLERIILSILIYESQFSAIGFIIAAKTLARYNKISENKEFAEYYLIGTLYSVLLVLVLFNILFY